MIFLKSFHCHLKPYTCMEIQNSKSSIDFQIKCLTIRNVGTRDDRSDSGKMYWNFVEVETLNFHLLSCIDKIPLKRETSFLFFLLNLEVWGIFFGCVNALAQKQVQGFSSGLYNTQESFQIHCTLKNHQKHFEFKYWGWFTNLCTQNLVQLLWNGRVL